MHCKIDILHPMTKRWGPPRTAGHGGHAQTEHRLTRRRPEALDGNSGEGGVPPLAPRALHITTVIVCPNFHFPSSFLSVRIPEPRLWRLSLSFCLDSFIFVTLSWQRDSSRHVSDCAGAQQPPTSAEVLRSLYPGQAQMRLCPSSMPPVLSAADPL